MVVGNLRDIVEDAVDSNADIAATQAGLAAIADQINYSKLAIYAHGLNQMEQMETLAEDSMEEYTINHVTQTDTFNYNYANKTAFFNINYADRIEQLIRTGSILGATDRYRCYGGETTAKFMSTNASTYMYVLDGQVIDSSLYTLSPDNISVVFESPIYLTRGHFVVQVDLVMIQEMVGSSILELRNQPEGLAGLDENGLIESAQLPSYVDDVLEFNTHAELPVEGESGKIYVVVTDETDLDSDGVRPTNTYRWSGTTYIRITDVLNKDEVKALYDSAYVPRVGSALIDAATNIDEAIDLLDQAAGTVGDLTALTTTDKTSIVAAINEVDAMAKDTKELVDNRTAALGTAIDTDGNYVPHTTSNLLNGNTSLTEDVLDLDGYVVRANTGAGLGPSGYYVPEVGSAYLDTATSLKEADKLLDTALTGVASKIITGAGEPTATLNPIENAVYLDTTTGRAYVCTDNTVDANVWTNEQILAGTYTNKVINDISNTISADYSHVKVMNPSTNAIPKGSTVNFSGGYTTDVMEVELGITGGVIGFASEEIPAGGYGIVLERGYLGSIDTSAFNIGEILYSGPSGSITNTPPLVSEGGVQKIGFVISSGVNGVIYVKTAFPENDASAIRYDETRSVADVLGALSGEIAEW